jgi:mono/diheme cytochrome c family protein
MLSIVWRFVKTLSPLGRGKGEGETSTSVGVSEHSPLTRRLRLHPLPRGERVLSLALLPLLLSPLPAAAEELATIAHGGRLYDNFHLELHERARRISHLSKNKVSGAAGGAVNRCVECHGWDYRGQDGATPTPAKGLTALDGGDPAKVVAALDDKTHNYGALLEPEDIEALALFVTRGQIDMRAFIDVKTGKVDGEPARGAVIFQTICAGCHGADGQLSDNMPPLGDFARANPHHALHSMLNGHPGGAMPALRAIAATQLADTLAYIQTLPSRYNVASIVRGGRLYDNWMKETGRPTPEGTHPLLPAGKTKDVKPGDTWRCVECHGWDYQGANGLTGLRGLAGKPAATIRKVLESDRHAFAKLLTERDKTDLSAFVAQGQVDSSAFIDAKTGKFRGDPPAGEPFFHTICAGCHGAEGKEIRTMPPLGRMANENPQHALHSIYNGHPGETMPPLRAIPDEVINAVMAYAQTLPTRK